MKLESVDSLRVLQKTRKKQNEELVHLTLAVPLTERAPTNDSIVVTAT